MAAPSTTATTGEDHRALAEPAFLPAPDRRRRHSLTLIPTVLTRSLTQWSRTWLSGADIAQAQGAGQPSSSRRLWTLPQPSPWLQPKVTFKLSGDRVGARARVAVGHKSCPRCSLGPWHQRMCRAEAPAGGRAAPPQLDHAEGCMPIRRLTPIHCSRWPGWVPEQRSCHAIAVGTGNRRIAVLCGQAPPAPPQRGLWRQQRPSVTFRRSRAREVYLKWARG